MMTQWLMPDESLCLTFLAGSEQPRRAAISWNYARALCQGCAEIPDEGMQRVIGAANRLQSNWRCAEEIRKRVN
jgi:hypothetical protein